MLAILRKSMEGIVVIIILEVDVQVMYLLSSGRVRNLCTAASLISIRPWLLYVMRHILVPCLSKHHPAVTVVSIQGRL